MPLRRIDEMPPLTIELRGDRRGEDDDWDEQLEPLLGQYDKEEG